MRIMTVLIFLFLTTAISAQQTELNPKSKAIIESVTDNVDARVSIQSFIELERYSFLWP